MLDFMRVMYRRYFKGLQVDTVDIRKWAQKEYCAKHKLPHFAPHDGICWCCKKQIYEKISLARAAGDLITGCPHCHRSYCD